MKNKICCIPFLLFAVLPMNGHQNSPARHEKTGTLKIRFVNTVRGIPVKLNTENYTNPFAEEYSISKFKYYISNVALAFTGGVYKESESYHLVDEARPESLSFSFPVNANTYQSLRFLLGVDSLHNVSGAQTGALDPLNDMFWTWNSGYIMAKLEGNSPRSNLVNKKIEYHIGGFAGEHSVLKMLKLDLPAGTALDITEGRTSELLIEADIDKWWQHPNDLKIADHPVCSTPGALARQIADNYSRMFVIKKITNN